MLRAPAAAAHAAAPHLSVARHANRRPDVDAGTACARRFLATVGNAWNTLPSGHAAGAAAVAVMVWRSGSPLSRVFAVLAIGIALGTVRGRYHYAVDTVLGFGLGVIAGITV